MLFWQALRWFDRRREAEISKEQRHLKENKGEAIYSLTVLQNQKIIVELQRRKSRSSHSIVFSQVAQVAPDVECLPNFIAMRQSSCIWTKECAGNI